MRTFLDLYAREPAVMLSSAGALVAAVLTLFVSFGVPITAEQRGAINALVVLVITIGAGVAIRSQVRPVVSSLPVSLPPH